MSLFDFIKGLGKSQQHAKFEVAILSRCRHIKGEPQIFESSLVQGHARFFSGCVFVMGIGKSQMHAKFDVAGFIYYGHIREFVLNDKFTF